MGCPRHLRLPELHAAACTEHIPVPSPLRVFSLGASLDGDVRIDRLPTVGTATHGRVRLAMVEVWAARPFHRGLSFLSSLPEMALASLERITARLGPADINDPHRVPQTIIMLPEFRGRPNVRIALNLSQNPSMMTFKVCSMSDAEVMVGRRRQRPSSSFTPEIDKRIIEGFLGDREEMIRDLAQAGFSRRAVLDRATTLGLTRDFLAQCKKGGVDVLVRQCLRCEQRFVSLGPQNRLCRRCLTRK